MESKPLPARRRIDWIDAVRGISILLMVVYHFCLDLSDEGVIRSDLIGSGWVKALQIFFSCLFILISGISCRFSGNNRRRGLWMLACGFAVTLVTWAYGQYIMNPFLTVRFGILHFLGTAALIFSLTQKYLDRFPGISLPLACLVLAVLTWPLPDRSFSVRFLWVFGIHSAEFSSGDYFPLMPYLFVYLIGTWIGRPIAEGRFPSRSYDLRFPVLAAVGRRTLWIYLAHQPLCIALIWLLERLGLC